MKIKKRILISILLILIILSTNIAVTLAATKSELQNKQNNINQQIKDTENEISAVKEEMSDTMKQIQDLNTQISGYQSEIDDLEYKISDLEKDIEESQEKLNEAEKNYNGIAIASFICGLVGLFYYQIPCGIAALITGIIGLIKYNPEKEKGKWMSITGIVLGSLEILWGILIIMLGIGIFFSALGTM